MSQLNMQWGGLVFLFWVWGEDGFLLFFVFPDVPHVFLYGVPNSNSHRK
jgi:hypothetical protein